MKKFRKQNNRNAYQVLEPRKMLAGDVTATVNDGLLQIIGDAEGNEIIVAGRPDGTATVFPIGDTTINGSTDPFVVSTTLDDVDVQLNAGDDNATIQGLVLSQSLRVRTNVGDDTTFVHHIEVQRFEQFSGDGDDTLEFNNVYSRGSILISSENNDDVVSITNMAAGTNATVETGNGVDTVAIDNLGVKDNINLNTGGANDQVIMTGLVYGYRANLILGEGSDSLNILPATSNETALFFRNLNVQGGAGDDSISMDASVTSRRNTVIGGDAGTDSIEQGGASLRSDTISSIENQQVDNLDALLDSVYAALTAADIDTTPFGGAVDPEDDGEDTGDDGEDTGDDGEDTGDDGEDTGDDGVEPAITATTEALVQNEDAGAQVLDDSLVLVGDDTTYTGATVSLGDTFIANQDVLAFDDNSTSDAITGTFDNTTGTITLIGDGTPGEYQAALRAITFNNTSQAPDLTGRTATFTVSRDGEDDLTATRDITVEASNDAPTVTGQTETITVNLDDNPTLPVALNENATITDADGIRLSGAVVIIDEGRQTDDVLAFTDDPDDDITGEFDADTGLLTFTGTADLAAYQALLRTVTFDMGATPTTGLREISFAVTDVSGANNATSAGATVMVDVITNTSNVLQGFSQTLNATTVGAPVALNPSLTISPTTDVELPINGAEVVISSGLASTQDRLTFEQVEGIEGVYDSAQGVLTFTPEDDLVDAQSKFQEVLQSVAYSNVGTNTDTTDRVIRTTLISNDDISITQTLNLTQPAEDREIQDFIADEANNFQNAQKSESGLYFSIETEGTGDVATLADEVRVSYRGTLLDGTEFDANSNATLLLSPRVEDGVQRFGVIEGWQEFFTQNAVGTKGQLLIPSSLGYGPNGNGSIPGDTPLFFDVELFEVIPDPTSTSS